jgi:diguanylate cyclase (GGDEF)-like protein
VEFAAIVLFDIDHFKQVNDRSGHAVGDETLVRVADVLRGAVRTGDLAVRIGGDEFLLVLGSTQLDVAAQRAEEIRAQIAAVRWEHAGCEERVTVSAGVAAGDPRQYDGMLAGADAALYRSKDAGGNTVHVC